MDETTPPTPADASPPPPGVPVPQTILDVLGLKFPGSPRTKLRAMLADKRVFLAGKVVVNAKQIVPRHTTVEVRDRAVAAAIARNLPFPVVFEDVDLLVIDKPAGVITSSGPKDKRPTVIGILREAYPKNEIGLIHRLDKDASGLLVFSKEDRAFAPLKRQFADKSATRVYRAIVSGKTTPAQGTIRSRLLELPDGRVVITRHPNRGEDAVTHYKTIENKGRWTMLEVSLETGRKHQIRVHLSTAGTPIAGDPVYHSNPALAPRLMLLAERLELDHPNGSGRMQFKADLPEEMTRWWSAQSDQSATQSNSKPKKAQSSSAEAKNLTPKRVRPETQNKSEE